MSEFINSDSGLCLDGYDVSGVSSKLPFKWIQEVKQWICFKDPALGSSDPLTRKRAPGAEDADLQTDGYLDFGTNWQEARDNLGASKTVLTYYPSRTIGGPAYIMPAVQADAVFGGPVGEVIPFAAHYQASGIVTAATLFEFRSVTATGNGTSQTLGAVTATQSLYLHVHSVALPGGSSPTLILVFESSADGTFGDAVTIWTFTTLTTRGKERKVVAGPVTDTHYRFRWTVGGSGGSFMIRLAAGIR
jgi:hypothetical protein